MEDNLVARIHVHVTSQSSGSCGAPATKERIEKAEKELGFSLPRLLKVCYEIIGNGGFGPGYGVIGVDGGAESDYGTLVGTYRQLETDQESEGNEWKEGLLPFCDWGCNIFSCVDCSDPGHAIWKFEDFDVWEQEINMEEFFELWIAGVNLIDFKSGNVAEKEVLNPFTGKTVSVAKRVR